MRPKQVLGGAIVLLGLLTAIQPSVPSVPVAQAADHEGHTVRVEGAIRDARHFDDGSRLLVVQDGHALVVDAPPTDAAPGSWARMEGRLVRMDGELRLRASTLAVVPGPDAPLIPLSAVAADPERWSRMRIHGVVDDGFLRSEGHAIRLGDGPWQDGPVEVRGVTAYDARCLCHVLHGDRVRPWTP